MEYFGWGIIGKLIAVALEQLYDCCVVEWFLGDDDAPESLMTEAEIGYNTGVWDVAWARHNPGDYYVIICDVFCLVDARTMECWHSSRLRIEANV